MIFFLYEFVNIIIEDKIVSIIVEQSLISTMMTRFSQDICVGTTGHECGYEILIKCFYFALDLAI